MTLKEAIQTQPHQLLFKASLIIGSIAFFFWRYDKRFGNNYADQSELEQFFRLLIGNALLLIPALLIYAVIYYVMHYMDRPTRPQLNLYHGVALVVVFFVQLILGAMILIWDQGGDVGVVHYAMRIASLCVPLLFLYNIGISLARPQKV